MLDLGQALPGGAIRGVASLGRARRGWTRALPFGGGHTQTSRSSRKREARPGMAGLDTPRHRGARGISSGQPEPIPHARLPPRGGGARLGSAGHRKAWQGMAGLRQGPPRKGRHQGRSGERRSVRLRPSRVVRGGVRFPFITVTKRIARRGGDRVEREPRRGVQLPSRPRRDLPGNGEHGTARPGVPWLVEPGLAGAWQGPPPSGGGT